MKKGTIKDRMNWAFFAFAVSFQLYASWLVLTYEFKFPFWGAVILAPMFMVAVWIVLVAIAWALAYLLCHTFRRGR